MVGNAYRQFMYVVYTNAVAVSNSNAWLGRLLSLPLGLLLLISIPIARIAQFLEQIVLLILQPWEVLTHAKHAMQAMIGVILSPILALVAAFMLASAMLVDPVTTSKRFQATCKPPK